MFRFLFVSALLSVGGVVAVWILVPYLSSAPPAAAGPPGKPDDNKSPDRAQAEKAPKLLHPVEQAPPRRSSQSPASPGQAAVYVYHNSSNSPVLSDPILITDCTLLIVEKQDVASEKEGILTFIGTEVKPGEIVPPENWLPDAKIGYLAVIIDERDPLRDGDKTFRYDGVLYRHIRELEDLPPQRVRLFSETLKVRKLQVGDYVKRGQLLALVEPRSAFDDVALKVGKLDGAEGKRKAAEAQKDLSSTQLRVQQELSRNSPGSVGLLEIEKTKAELKKYAAEEYVEQKEVVIAQRTLNDALTKLKMHEIRAAIDGVIKVLYKNHQGDAVKAYETIMQIQNPARLRVDGRLELQEALKLEKGMTAIVEATRPEAPRLVLSGHLDTVNCVAVSKGKRPVIVSGSDDQTLRGWDAVSGDKLWAVWNLRSAVRCVACAPPASKYNLACFGCADGTVRLLDLEHPEQKPRELSERHRGPVLGVAFSPDGETIATCGDDRLIRLWKTETGDLLHTLSNHSAPVTSVQFASANRLVSAGDDKRLVVWDVEAGKPPHAVSPRFDGRGGEVLTLGVSPDGKTVLFDQGKELRLLTLDDRKQIVGTLQNPADAMNFSTMALFSPDGKTILTNGSAPGKLQLWRTPVTQTRGSELRQFIWKDTATCGAFAPEPEGGSFAVTGTQDHKVLVWNMPSKEEIDSRLEAKLTLVEKYLDTQSRHVRVWAELQNPGWLIPGMRATMVVLPPRK